MEIGALIVDDEDDIRLLIRVLIEAANRGLFVSGEASDGSQALERLEELNPEVVILDQRMPDMDGLETATLILRRRPGQRIILCSAHLDDDLRARAAAAGITICLTKAEMSEIPRVLRESVVSGG